MHYITTTSCQIDEWFMNETVMSPENNDMPGPMIKLYSFIMDLGTVLCVLHHYIIVVSSKNALCYNFLLGQLFHENNAYHQA